MVLRHEELEGACPAAYIYQFFFTPNNKKQVT